MIISRYETVRTTRVLSWRDFSEYRICQKGDKKFVVAIFKDNPWEDKIILTLDEFIELKREYMLDRAFRKRECVLQL